MYLMAAVTYNNDECMLHFSSLLIYDKLWIIEIRWVYVALFIVINIQQAMNYWNLVLHSMVNITYIKELKKMDDTIIDYICPVAVFIDAVTYMYNNVGWTLYSRSLLIYDKLWIIKIW